MAFARLAFLRFACVLVQRIARDDGTSDAAFVRACSAAPSQRRLSGPVDAPPARHHLS